MNFRELGLNEQLLSGLDAIGFEAATPIQEKAIPIILKGKDLIACAQTGTGKTAAFLLPIVNKLTDKNTDYIDTLILVPTRELAVQIDQQLEGLAYFTGVNSVAIYGGRDGISFDQERKALSLGADIIIATPGRLIAHLNMGYVKINQLNHLILDEADRMLDMGFVHDIKKIMNYLPKNRQTLMFSATMPHKIRQFAKKTLHKPEQINLAVSKPAEGVMQGAYLLPDELKSDLLLDLLGKRKTDEEKILIFSSTKSNVKKLSHNLKVGGLNADEIHSDLDQGQRELILRKFKNGSLPILVATDILSRGIDVQDINLVVNYDVPHDAEDYIHRVGRTARASTTGVALTLVNRKDKRKFYSIESFIGAKIQKLPLPKVLEEQIKKDTPSSSQKSKKSNNRNYSKSSKNGQSSRPYKKKKKKVDAVFSKYRKRD